MDESERQEVAARWLAKYGEPIHALQEIIGPPAVAAAQHFVADRRLIFRLMQTIRSLVEDLGDDGSIGERVAQGAVEVMHLMTVPGHGKSHSWLGTLQSYLRAGGREKQNDDGAKLVVWALEEMSRFLKGEKTESDAERLRGDLRKIVGLIESSLPDLDPEFFSPPLRGPAYDVGLLFCVDALDSWIQQHRRDGLTSGADIAAALEYFGHEMPTTADPGGDLLRKRRRIMQRISPSE